MTQNEKQPNAVSRADKLDISNAILGLMASTKMAEISDRLADLTDEDFAAIENLPSELPTAVTAESCKRQAKILRATRDHLQAEEDLANEQEKGGEK